MKSFLKHLVKERGLGNHTAAHAHTALSSLWTWAARELKSNSLIRQVEAEVH